MKNAIRTITRKSLLYKSRVEYAEYGLNHVEGCAHGCRYPCYAMMLKKRCGAVKSYEDWIRPKLVSNALGLLDEEIPRLKDKVRRVFLCFSTDPFMYQVDEVQALSLEILERLNNAGIQAVLVSKGAYPSVLTDTARFGDRNEYGSTIVSLSEDFRKKYEPNAAPIESRISSLQQLHEAGLSTWVSMEPYPTPNIVDQDIKGILNRIGFVERIVFGKWNYNATASQFLHSREFYNSMAAEVMKFCNERSIDLHVKEGTLKTPSTSAAEQPRGRALAGP